MKKLTSFQIDQLYQFTRKHYVEHYDLQTELVDHLANAIEQQWLSKQELTFEEALVIEFKKFGIFGFSDIVDERRRTLTIKYNQIIKQHFVDFFSWPKFVQTIILFFGLYIVLKHQLIPYSFQILFTLPLVFAFYFIFKYSKQHNKRLAITKKKWLFEEIIFSFGSLLPIFQIPFQIALFINNYNMSNVGIWFISFFLTLLYLLTFIMIYEIPQKAENYLIENYPEYHLV